MLACGFLGGASGAALTALGCATSSAPIIGAHVLGMYLLVPVVGALVDRIGRPPALAGGFAVVAVRARGSSRSGAWG